MMEVEQNKREQISSEQLLFYTFLRPFFLSFSDPCFFAMHRWQNQLSVSAGGTRIPTQILKINETELLQLNNKKIIIIQCSPMIPIVTFVATYHRSSIILAATSWTNPNLISEFVLQHIR